MNHHSIKCRKIWFGIEVKKLGLQLYHGEIMISQYFFWHTKSVMKLLLKLMTQLHFLIHFLSLWAYLWHKLKSDCQWVWQLSLTFGERLRINTSINCFWWLVAVVTWTFRHCTVLERSPVPNIWIIGPKIPPGMFSSHKASCILSTFTDILLYLVPYGKAFMFCQST